MSELVPSQVKDFNLIQTRRHQIIQAAVKLFTEKGFHKTTTREIAKASGLSNGALYEYVESKEAVLFLVCQHIHREMKMHLEQSLSSEVAGPLRLENAIRAFFRVVEAMQADILLIYQESKSLPKPYLRAVLQEDQSIVDMFAQLLREGKSEGSLHLQSELIPVLAHDIVVTGQMWAFRRWALRHIEFSQFSEAQVRMLMLACGATSTFEAALKEVETT